jgi:uncharacterized LabA/DUF88 family protein
LLCGEGMRTIIYVDGFNLYNRRLKPLPRFKWLNLKTLGDVILKPPMVVTRVNYYTARVSGKLDPGAPARQQAYLDALATVPEIATHFGNFMFSQKWAALVRPPQARPSHYVWPAVLPALVKVERAEEKGSDVNLASHLVRDALLNAFDVAVIVTNDTDLIEPIKIVMAETGKKVGLLSPVRAHKYKSKWTGAHPTLVAAASWTLYIHNAHLAQAQFPASLPGTTITRPAAWV